MRTDVSTPYYAGSAINRRRHNISQESNLPKPHLRGIHWSAANGQERLQNACYSSHALVTFDVLK
jgi:hypothetical protein